MRRLFRTKSKFRQMQAIRKSLNASGKKEPREILFQNISMADQKKRKRSYGQQPCTPPLSTQPKPRIFIIQLSRDLPGDALVRCFGSLSLN